MADAKQVARELLNGGLIWPDDLDDVAALLRPHLEPAAAQSLAIYKCKDCGCTFAATICFPAKQLEHFQAAVGDDGTFINNCPHCGGTMIEDIGPKQPSTSSSSPAPTQQREVPLPGEENKCCDNGDFGDGHICLKQPSKSLLRSPVVVTAPPKPSIDEITKNMRVRGGTLEDFKKACEAPAPSEGAPKNREEWISLLFRTIEPNRELDGFDDAIRIVKYLRESREDFARSLSQSTATPGLDDPETWRGIGDTYPSVDAANNTANKQAGIATPDTNVHADSSQGTATMTREQIEQVAKDCQHRIWELWHRAKADFGQASYQQFVAEFIRQAIENVVMRQPNVEPPTAPSVEGLVRVLREIEEFNTVNFSDMPWVIIRTLQNKARSALAAIEKQRRGE